MYTFTLTAYKRKLNVDINYSKDNKNVVLLVTEIALLILLNFLRGNFVDPRLAIL